MQELQVIYLLNKEYKVSLFEIIKDLKKNKPLKNDQADFQKEANVLYFLDMKNCIFLMKNAFIDI